MRNGVYLLWSGESGKHLARVLSQAVFDLFDPIHVFYSEETIQAGTQWRAVLDAGLAEHTFGVLVATPAILNSEWILYEAGAITKGSRDKDGRLATVLALGLERAALPSPLTAFQDTTFTLDGIKRLFKSINARRGAPTIDAGKVERFAEDRWPRLAAALEEASRLERTSAPTVTKTERDLSAVLQTLHDLQRSVHMLERKSAERPRRSSPPDRESPAILTPFPPDASNQWVVVRFGPGNIRRATSELDVLVRKHAKSPIVADIERLHGLLYGLSPGVVHDVMVPTGVADLIGELPPAERAPQS